MRYFLLDRIMEFQVNESAVGIKNITLSEDIFQDHFPEHPVFPGAMLIEAMAQLGGFLLEMSVNKPNNIRRALLAQVDKAKFHRMAEPGEQLVIYGQMAEQMEDAAKINIRVENKGEKSASAKLTFVLKSIG